MDNLGTEANEVNLDDDDLIYTPQVSDELRPKKGQEFDTIDDVLTFYNAYAKAAGFSVRSSTTCKEPESCEIRRKEYVCFKQGKSLKIADVGKKRRRGNLAENCTAKIAVLKSNSGKYIVTVFNEEHNQIQRKKLATSKVREIVYDKDLDLVSCSCKKFESAGIVCSHIISYLMKFDAEILPDKYILQRWTKSAKSGIVVDDKGMQINPDNSYLLTRSQFIQSSLELVDKSLVCEETRKMFTDGVRIINEQIDQFISSRTVAKSFTEKNSFQNNVDDGTSVQDSCTFQNSFNEPDQVRAKGCGKRLKGGKEKAMARAKNKKDRRCHGCGKVGQSHDKRNCPAFTNPSSTCGDTNWQEGNVSSSEDGDDGLL